MTTPSIEELLDFALDAAWQAGRLTLGYFQTAVSTNSTIKKADNTPVTVADKEAESLLRRLISARYPAHGIMGEEHGQKSTNPSARYQWVIDPIDGTKSFVAGVPIYATLLALMDGDQAIIGIIHLPALNETIYATRGGGCYWNGRRARVSDTTELKDAVLLSTSIDYSRYPLRKQIAWKQLVKNTYIQRTWGDAYGYALIATGRADIMLDPAMYFWDIAPLQVIMEEAGGTLTDWNGEPTIHNAESIATNGVLLNSVMAITAEK